jgi:hypothetical protein
MAQFKTGVTVETKRETVNDGAVAQNTAEAALAKAGSVRAVYYAAKATAVGLHATKNGEVIAIIDV